MVIHNPYRHALGNTPKRAIRGLCDDDKMLLQRSISKTINYGILGAGHLGNYHAQQLRQIPGVNLVGVFDINSDNSKKLSLQNNIPAFPSAKELLASCDAVSVATPASNHYETASLALENNCNVFIEKPFTKNVEEAAKLIDLKNLKNLKIQVGHIERFNPAFVAFKKTNPSPLFVESHRLCSYNQRGLDVDVILDLMIHDIDLILFLIKSKIKEIHAFGEAILTDSIDIANARIVFQGGQTANLTASRISLKQMRQMRVFQKKSYNVIDFKAPALNAWFINKQGLLKNNGFRVAPSNALFEELSSFIVSIQQDAPEIMGAEEAFAALGVASKIQEKIEK